MEPKPFTTYKMKKSFLTLLHVSQVKGCATECGNRFRYLPKGTVAVNMECMRCGYQFRTMIHTFWERYEKVKSDLNVKDPNFLFKSEERQ